jgi:hypothetical protein
MDDQRTNREGDYGISRKQFPLAALFKSTALIALGLGGMTFLVNNISTIEKHYWQEGLLLFCGSFALIGAGLLIPLRRATYGALVGCGIAVLILALLLFVFLNSHIH